MKNYVGVKIVSAMPMNLGDYNIHKGWTIPDNENPLDEGYLVEYSSTYQSWCPKAEFEKANACLEGISYEGAKKEVEILFAKAWDSKPLNLRMSRL